MNKVALITGATRGIGRAISIGLAKKGYNIVVAGKSTKNDPNLPGSIYSVADEIRQAGVRALPFKLDVRDEENVKKMYVQVREEFGRLDVVVNNAGALDWESIEDTSMKKYDLINDINCRGSFMVSKFGIPLMLESGGGHIITMSPPLAQNIAELKTLKNKIAYMISKWGMTFGALGIAEEYSEKGIAVNTLWPMTAIESYAVKNNNLGDERIWRKQDIMVDVVNHIVDENPNKFTGNQLVDELYLRKKGVTDFSKYQCITGSEPPPLRSLL
uniref:SDR family NAD(P)-dependent oxidoreductase n=1 Tax=viral metagenome TaxID=1070528 RepID=A0A6C0EI99_9ZZZZ